MHIIMEHLNVHLDLLCEAGGWEGCQMAAASGARSTKTPGIAVLGSEQTGYEITIDPEGRYQLTAGRFLRPAGQHDRKT